MNLTRSGPMPNGSFHTCSSSCWVERAWPGWRTNVSRSWNSSLVRPTTSPSTRTSRAGQLTSRLPSRYVVGSSTATGADRRLRRISTWMRLLSSSTPNGFAR